MKGLMLIFSILFALPTLRAQSLDSLTQELEQVLSSERFKQRDAQLRMELFRLCQALEEKRATAEVESKAWQALLSLPAKKDTISFIAMEALSVLYRHQGEYEKSEPLAKEGVELARLLYGNLDAHYADALNRQANLYLHTGQFSQAEQLYKESLSVWKNNEGAESLNYAIGLNNLGILYINMQRYDDALSVLQKASDIYKKQPIFKEEDLAKRSHYAALLTNLAVVNYYQKQYLQAEKFYKQANAIYFDIAPKGIDYAGGLNNLGSLYLEQEKFAEAEAVYLKAKQLTEWLGEHHPYYLHLLFNIANCYTLWGRHKEGLAYIRLVLACNCPDLPPLDRVDAAWSAALTRVRCYDKLAFLYTLSLLEERLQLLHPKDEREQRRWLAASILEIGRQMRDAFTNEAEKIELLSAQYAWFEKSLGLFSREEAGEAFAVSEQSKAVLLLDAVKTDRAYQFGDLPDSLRRKEEFLQAEQSELQALLLSSLPKLQADSLRRRLNEINATIEDFKRDILQRYPRYAQLKHQASSVDIKALQEQMGKSTAMLEYFLGDSSSYAFYLSSDTIFFTRLDLRRDTLRAHIGWLRRCVSDYELLQQDPDMSHARYRYHARALHQILIEQLPISDRIEELIIIPDGELAHIPFETLLTAACDDAQMPYSELPFLLHRYRVSYHYSAQLWQSQKQQAQQKGGAALSLLALAADYSRPNDSIQSRRVSSDWSLRLGLKPLKAASEEIAAVAALFDGRVTMQNHASEAQFKQWAADYDILHLALHGLVDEQSPVRSSLAFTEDGGTENNFLQAYEISQMPLNARLVVLSACETGYGKLEKGNGVASIARAFMYAGVPSLVVSLWSVNDQTTALLMPFFYESLASGLSQSQALQQAKITYLRHAKGIAAHPAFWSAFVHFGDNSPLAISVHKSRWHWYLLIGAGLLLGLLLIKKILGLSRKPKH